MSGLRYAHPDVPRAAAVAPPMSNPRLLSLRLGESQRRVPGKLGRHAERTRRVRPDRLAGFLDGQGGFWNISCTPYPSHSALIRSACDSASHGLNSPDAMPSSRVSRIQPWWAR